MKEKTAFVVGLLGVVVAMAPFKDALAQSQLNFGFAHVSVLALMYISLGILFLSTYVFALEYVRDGFKLLDNLPVFRYLQLFGNVLYFVAILSPFIYLFLWLVVQLYLLIPSPTLNLKKAATWFSVATSLLAFILSVLAAWRQYKGQMIAKEESLDASAISAASEAKKLVENRMWSLSIIEAFRSLELSLNKKIVTLGIDTRTIPSFRAAQILARNEVISKDDLRRIEYVRDLRNRAAHSSVEFSEEEALEVLDIVKRVLPKLETAVPRGQMFEDQVFNALVSKNGLFLHHHFFPQYGVQDTGFDAKAEGPGYTYLIEIRLSANPRILRKALEQLKHFGSPQHRLLLVVPGDASQVPLDGDNAKVLYYDSEQDRFTNRDEIYRWIYGEPPTQKGES